MIFQHSQFKFVVKSRRFTDKIWNKYNSLKKKQKTEKLTDNDKFFLRQVREAVKVHETEVTVTHVPTKLSLSTIVKGPKINRRDMMLKILAKVKETRNATRKVKNVVKDFDGATYDVVGGVFVKGGKINEIAKLTTTNDPYAHKKPRHKNKNYIGIEVEFNETRGVSQEMIADTFKNSGLARYVNVTTDGSCGWEVRVLLPEDDFIEPLTKILKVIRDLGHTADHRCGTHIHFDMRNRDIKLVYENLFKTQKFLRKFLTRGRKHNRFCMMNKAETFDKQLSLGERYYALNVQSFARHKTLEVRMHQGTLDHDELLPWIKLLLKVVNYQTAMPIKVNTLKQARKQFELDETLGKNLEQRILSVFRAGPATTGAVNV